MAAHALSDHFAYFFSRLNPSPTFEAQASSQYTTIKALIEDANGAARELSPQCFLQGSYRQATAIHTINDVDIVVLCQLWQPPSGGAGAGRGWSRDDIFNNIRGIEYDGLDRTVDVRISRLRKKLHDNSSQPQRIKTVWGKGYLFVGDAWN